MEMDKWLKVGIVHFMAFPQCIGGDGPILETVETIVNDEFFSSIEVGIISDERIRSQVADLLRVGSLKVGFGAQPVVLRGKLDFSSADPAVRRHAIETIKGVIPQAAQLGAGALAMLSGPDKPEEERPRAFERLHDALVEIGRACEAHGLGLTLETFDRTVDKKALVGSNAEANGLAQEVRRSVPSFGLMLDLSHFPIQFEGIREAVIAARETLVWAHCGNAILKEGHPLSGDNHPRFGHPDGFNGAAELRTYIDALINVGYLAPEKGSVLAFEVKPAPGESSQAVIANAKRTLKEAWAGVKRRDEA
jgi:sugar phosphate isomerase/epimerase